MKCKNCWNNTGMVENGKSLELDKNGYCPVCAKHTDNVNNYISLGHSAPCATDLAWGDFASECTCGLITETS